MPANSAHFEVAGDTPQGWAVLEVFDKEQAAVDGAQKQTSKGYAAVRVTEVRFDDETGAFQNREVLFLGKRRRHSGNQDTADLGPVCTGYKDFYRSSSRRAIRRLLGDWMSQMNITAIEFLHHPDYMTRLENAGTLLQGAVQRVAMAQARPSGKSVQARTRELFKLVDYATLQIRKDARQGRFPELEHDDINGLVDAVRDQTDAPYLVNIVISQWLQEDKSTGAKLGHLLVLLADVDDDAIGFLDDFVADFLDEAAAVTQALGPQPNLGAAVLQIANLLMGTYQASESSDPGLVWLSNLIAAGAMKKSRNALSRRLGSILAGQRNLIGDDLAAEIKFNADLQRGLKDRGGNFVGGEAVADALANRSERHLYPEAIARLTEEAREPADRLERLLDIEPGIIGLANKRKLGEFILPIVLAPSNAELFVDGTNQPQVRMQRLVQLQQRIAASELYEVHKAKALEILDEFCIAIIRKTKIFERIMHSNAVIAEKAVTILKLCSGGMFTQGRALIAAQRVAVTCIKDPNFTASLLRADTDRAEKQKRYKAFQQLLREAGIPEAEIGTVELDL